tara:strand:- start:35 stop:676 length:642 start_codon:yes stop_codon:yes gene_type:complete
MSFWYQIVKVAAKVVSKVVCSFRVQNGANLESVDGGLIIASNHVSFVDPPFIGGAFKKPIYYFARKTLFDHPVANFLLTRVNALPVNQDKPELSVLKKIISLLKADERVLIFPEGERSYDGVMKMEGEPGIGMIVTKAKVPVLPIRIFGAEKALPRGEKRLHRHPVTLVVGEPICFDEIEKDESLGSKEKYQAIANKIMQAIERLELSDSRGE